MQRKFNESKTVINAPESDPDNDQPNYDLENIRSVPETTNASEAYNKPQQPKQHRNYSRHIIGPLKATGRATLRVINRIDQKGPFVTAIATVLIAILTGFYVYYSRAQWSTMNRQLSQVQSQQRPWVSAFKGFHNLIPSDLYDLPTFPDKVKASIKVTNTGQSPAFHVKTAVCWIVSPNTDESPPVVDVCHDKEPPNAPHCSNGEQSKITETTLFPNTGIDTTEVWDNFRLSDSDLMGIERSKPGFAGDKSKQEFLYVVGCSAYDDGAGTHYRTQFCMIYAPESPPSQLSKLRSPVPGSPEGNRKFYDRVYRSCAGGNSTETQKNGQYLPD
jgi:hypothetical protein